MGSVYRAADESLGRDVALKILDTTMERSTARFRAEASALARLSHPGIAAVYELVEDGGHLVMAMEYVRGQSLQQILEQVGAFSPRRAAELCMQALAALEHAHAAGVVHRDLKPGNLMLTENGSIKIMDFGIARLEGAVNLTSAGAMLGTPAYMAPEQVLGHPVDARADLYAIGVVFFRLVTAALPFKAETPFDMAQAQVNETPAHARDLRPELPEWVDAILTRALAKKPAERFQSAMSFHEALALACASTPEPIAAAAEFTEAMVRPTLDPPAAAARTDESPGSNGGEVGTERGPRAHWLTAGAAAALAGAVWLSTSGSPATSNAPATPSLALVESTSQPATQSGTAEPATRRASSDDRAVLAPASFSPANEDAGRGARTAKPPASGDAGVLPPVSFSNVKLLAVNGARTSTSDAVVQLASADVTVQPANSKAAPATLPYQRIVKATYTHGRDPKWDPALNGPGAKIDVPGILGRSRHWLVLQGPDGYVILRLDGDNWLDLLKAFEDRAGLVIDRPATVKNPG
jgi:serine/threonine protein kinase